MVTRRKRRTEPSSRDYGLELTFAAEARRLPSGERRGILDRLRRHEGPRRREPVRDFYELDPCTGRWKRL
jgi:hypothetical protein